MPISFAQGFELSSNEPIDKRLVMTKAEMLATKKPTMPSVYFTICSDDGKMYIYNSSNDVDTETGRFRLLQSLDGSNTEVMEQIVSSDDDNLIEVTESGLKVSEYDSIGSDTISNLFINE